MEVELFRALGDPLRLKLVKRLSDGSVYTLGDLTKGLGMSRQAARKQVGILEDAHLLRLKPNGREVNVSLNIDALQSAKKFIAGLEAVWDKRLARLKSFVERE